MQSGKLLCEGSKVFWLSSVVYILSGSDAVFVIRTEIEWVAGKNLTQKVLKKKPKKGAKNTKPVTKTEQCESFFNFFNPPQVPDDDDIDQDTVKHYFCNFILSVVKANEHFEDSHFL